MQLLMNTMDKQDDDHQTTAPVLHRLDRLDRILQLLEEKHSLSASHRAMVPVSEKANKHEGDQCIDISSALEEVQHKGTLVERLAMLENRVLQLSLDMDEGNTSNSSSYTNLSSEKLDRSFKSPSGSDRKDETHVGVTGQKKGSKSVRRKSKGKGNKNWLGLFHLGCN